MDRGARRDLARHARRSTSPTGLDDAQRAFEACDRGEPAVGFGEIYIQTGYDPSPAPRGPPPAERLRPVRALRHGLDDAPRRGRQAVHRPDRPLRARASTTSSSPTRCSARPTSRSASGSPRATSSRARSRPDQMWEHRLTPRTPIDGFYFCGAATHPGGSVIALNGRNAAMAVLADARVAGAQTGSVGLRGRPRRRWIDSAAVVVGEATRIQLCGRLIVELQGRRLEDTLRGRQGRLLFAYLALHRDRPVRRDELAEALWSGKGAPPAYESLLAPPLSRLRKALGPGVLEGRSELQLVLPAGRLDRLGGGARAGRAAARADNGGASTPGRRPSEAVEIAERGLLPGLEAPWIDTRRGELADLRVEALEALAVAGTRLGGAAWPEAEQAARAAVQAQPFRESARAALMEVLRARGNVNEALRVYEDIRVLLREELGSSPGPALVALHEQLLRDEPRPRAVEPPRAEDPAALVERDREVALLDTLLEEATEGEGRAVLIEGPPGIGKSRLLSEFRRRAGAEDALVLNARAGELEREFPFGVVRQLFEAVVADPDALAGAAAAARVVFASPDNGRADRRRVLRRAARPVLAGAQPRRRAPAAARGRRPALVRPPVAALPRLPRAAARGPAGARHRQRAHRRPADRRRAAGRDRQRSRDRARPARPAVRGGRRPARRAPARRRARPRVPRGLPPHHRRQPAARPPAAERARDRRASSPTPRTPTSCARSARAPSRARCCCGSRGCRARRRRSRAPSPCSARAPTCPPWPASSGLDEAQVAGAMAALARAEILRPEPPPGFVHPLVRDAVYHGLPLGERELLHARAARRAAPTRRVAGPDRRPAHAHAAARRRRRRASCCTRPGLAAIAARRGRQLGRLSAARARGAAAARGPAAAAARPRRGRGAHARPRRRASTCARPTTGLTDVALTHPRRARARPRAAVHRPRRPRAPRSRARRRATLPPGAGRRGARAGGLRAHGRAVRRARPRRDARPRTSTATGR